jgi:hypothetical protein
MDNTVVVMIVMLALPDGQESVNVKPMVDVAACREAAKIEISDPFVADVACSELRDGKLELTFKKQKARKVPQTSNFKSTG